MSSATTGELKNRIEEARSSLEVCTEVLAPSTDEPENQNWVKSRIAYYQTEIETCSQALTEFRSECYISVHA